MWHAKMNGRNEQMICVPLNPISLNRLNWPKWKQIRFFSHFKRKRKIMVITSIWKNHIGNQEATITFKTVNKHYEWMKWEKRSYIFDWKYHSIGKRIKMNRNLTQNTDKNYKKFQQQKKCGKNMMNVMHLKSVFFLFSQFRGGLICNKWNQCMNDSLSVAEHGIIDWTMFDATNDVMTNANNHSLYAHDVQPFLYFLSSPKMREARKRDIHQKK